MNRAGPASVVLLVLSTALLASCGGSGSKSTNTTTASRCDKVPSGLRAYLAESLSKGKTLGPAAAVRSNEDFPSAPPRLTRAAVYFVSADVRPSPGVATWAVSESSFKGKSGLIIGVDAAARAASYYGATPKQLTAWGLTESADGFSESRECLPRAVSSTNTVPMAFPASAAKKRHAV